MTNLKSTLDKVFSEFIRLRDSDANGIVRCISCGKLIPWKESDCGHFVNRSHMNTRYDERNCNAQCRSCNRFDEGNNIGYTRGLIKKYGEKIIDELYLKKHIFRKYDDWELSQLVKHYREEVKKLKAEKR